LGGDPWVLPIYAQVHRAVQAQRYASLPAHVTDLGLHISIRLNILSRVHRRLLDELGTLELEARDKYTEAQVFTSVAPGIVLDIDANVKYLVMADLHNFVSELDACLDQMKKFMHGLHENVGVPIDEHQRIALLNSFMRPPASNAAWFSLLAHCRNFIAHAGALYPVIDITNPNGWDVLLVKKRDWSFAQPRSYVRLSEVGGIVVGFTACKRALQQHLIGLFT
jgi:hypothetical protein